MGEAKAVTVTLAGICPGILVSFSDLYQRRKGGPCALSLMAMGDTGAAKCRLKAVHKVVLVLVFTLVPFDFIKHNRSRLFWQEGL